MRAQNFLTLKVLTPVGTLIERSHLSGITIPLVNGYPIGIRPGHAPLIAETSQGQIKYRETGEVFSIDLHAGVVDIRDHVVTILTPGEVDATTQVPATEKEYNRLMRTFVQQVTQPNAREEQNSD